MGAKLDFGRMYGAKRPLYVQPSLPSTRWLDLKGQRWRSYVKSQGREEVGTSDLKDILMTGRWRWFSDSFVQLALKVLALS